MENHCRVSLPLMGPAIINARTEQTNSRALVVSFVSDERSRCRRLQLTHPYLLPMEDASVDMRTITRVDTHAEGEIDGYFRMVLVSAKFVLSNACFADQHEHEGAEALG